MSPSVSPRTQTRPTDLSAQWQLWPNCHQYLHVNYHLDFYNYLMNPGGKVVPLRKMKLLQKCMTKEKHKSLPARAWTTDVLTRPAASSLHPGADRSGAILSFPSGVGSSSPTFWARRCSGLECLFWRAACCSQSGMAAIGPLQHGYESQPVMEEKDFCLGFS